jgi:sigma-B regulation protein RsbU (phosphoserine phosphatase)
VVIAACVVLIQGGPSGHAQGNASQASHAVFDATKLREPADLDSPWLIRAGDDPAYARPDFDDSQWALFDPHGDMKSVFKTNRPEVIWYRLRVKVSPGQTGLALREENIARAFEIYVNGERVIAEGQIAPFIPYTWNAKVLELIPNRLLASGSIVVALRVHIAPSEWAGEEPGYSAGNLTIGQQTTLRRFDSLDVIGQYSCTWLDHLLLACLGLVALVLFAAQRRQTEYLWIAALGVYAFVRSIEPVISVFYNFPLYWEALGDTLRVVVPFLWVSLYFSFIQQRIGWRWRAILVIAGILNAFSGIQGHYLVLPLVVEFLSNLLFIILLSGVIPVVLAIHWRRGNREAGILLIPAVLFSIYIYAEIGFDILFQFSGMRGQALRGLNLIDRFPAGPFSISLSNVSEILSTLALAIIMLLRSSRMSRRQAILEGELAAAQQVQQVLLPEQVEKVPGFQVESVYQPAQQVGGDFFQILPAGEGGLLVVLGDVAGKGLPAAMLVSELVGSIRGVAEYTADPAELLASLNERLVGRGGGSFSTALVAHISANGEVIVANAGHLSPYLDGREVELPGALPLGVMSGARYETTQFYLAPGSRLTFYSDGVIEAQNQQGELFGFDRARDISTQPAADIVEAAKKFGQEDDITVVTIDRHAAVATAA